MEPPPQQPRQKIPLDGPGPRGLPDCYYTSRVLNSTFRYVKFVRKLRAEEEEQRQGALSKLKELKDKQNNDFFIRCDRRSLIKNVARRVDLCMQSYQDDLQSKRRRLIALYSQEEKDNIRKFVIQAQAGVAEIWQEKMNRLDYLLKKRRKEHEEKYKDIPLTKAAHVHPCIVKLRCKEAQEIQRYQIRENQSRKIAEKEMDKMWYEVAMRESEALAARMEQDAIDRYRRDIECKKHSDLQLQQRRIQQEKDRETLKRETKWLNELLEEANRQEEEAERLRAEKRMEAGAERKQMIVDKQLLNAKREANEKRISDTWASLTNQGLADDKAKIELIKQKEKELDTCNKKMIELRDDFAKRDVVVDAQILEEGKRTQDALETKRCQFLLWSQKTNRDVRQAMIDQIKERKASKEQLKKKLEEQDEYHRQLHEQQSHLIDHKAATDAAARKKYQNDLLQQIEYTKVLKERARQEEVEQIKKYKIAADDYQKEINTMLCRTFFCDEIHPFMKQMSKGIKMQDKCPCSKPDYCKVDYKK